MEEEEEEDPTFVPFQHNGIEGELSEDDSEDSEDSEDEEDSESSEDYHEDEDETLKSVENVAKYPGEKSVESYCPVLEEGNYADSEEIIQSGVDETAAIERDEITKDDSSGGKRKIEPQEVGEEEEEHFSKRQRNVVEEESGKSYCYDLNNSLETGYTSDVYSYSDLEDTNEIYSDSYITSY